MTYHVSGQAMRMITVRSSLRRGKVNEMQGSGVPKHIEPDAIIEAMVDFRFEHSDLPELVLGRLLDLPLWENYTQTRLPTADIPQPIREANPQLRYQPLVELRSKDASRIVKIGGHVMSYHIPKPYPGWAIFQQEIGDILKEAISRLRSPQISRIGFRYINVFRPDEHHIHGISETNINLRVGNEELTNSVMINYIRKNSTEHIVTVRIVTPDLVESSIPTGYSLLCDIEVATSSGNFIATYDDAINWIDTAHSIEKSEFFSLIPENIMHRLNPTYGVNENE